MRAVFLDLNGTLVLPVQVQHPREYALIPAALTALRMLRRHDFLCPVITVQSRIARGVYSVADFRTWFRTLQQHLEENGAEIVGPYVCPHGRNLGGMMEACACRKPQTLLYEQAAANLGIDVRQSLVVGDSAADMLAARKRGCPGILVRTGWGEWSIRNDGADRIASFVAADIAEATEWIVAREAAL